MNSGGGGKTMLSLSGATQGSRPRPQGGNELQPIFGTGLNIPSLQTSLQANGNSTSVPVSDGNPPKQHRTSNSKKPSSRQTSSQPTTVRSPGSGATTDVSFSDDRDISTRSGDDDLQSGIVAQVYEWLQHEKARRKARKSRRSGVPASIDNAGSDDDTTEAPLERTASQNSEGAFALEKLERILSQYASASCSFGPRWSGQRRRLRKGLQSGSVSESDHPDFEGVVPSVDAFLDNSKTLSYTGGAVRDNIGDCGSSAKRALEKDHWLMFKNEILRLIHTLRLKGWRKVPLESASEIGVERLSGALTNAVYVVAPPKSLSASPNKAEAGSAELVPRKPPPKLLLRIYGPQVDHLIDREIELRILRRLGRKNIGPKVLGTFRNGRFEEYFEARPLIPRDLRNPEISKQIAKRMRELHDGMELLDEERAGGPMVFRNWNKWVDRCEKVIGWLDKELASSDNEAKAQYEPWRRRGFICVLHWAAFRKAVEMYRKWLITDSGGLKEINRHLVFAHNDTQYGNLLRLQPSGESPLLLPANEHKQLVVIDFEYASANTPAFEFANHFTEWCYDYHDPDRPWACNVRRYPTPEEQHRFVTAYLKHKPGVGGRSPASPFVTPYTGSAFATSPYLAPLDLDEAAATTTTHFASIYDTERTQEEYIEAEAQYLLRQARLWRAINSAQWVAWGIVQAKVAGMNEAIATAGPSADGGAHASKRPESGSGCEQALRPFESSEALPNVDADVDGADEFDYLAYAQDRAMFFWADLLGLGVIKEEELPSEMLEHVRARIVDY